MRFWLAFVAVFVALFGGLVAFAGDPPACAGKAQAKSDCAKKCAAVAKASCEVGGKKVEYDMPALVYKVGDVETPCEKTALETAKGDEKAIKFIVAGKSYDTKSEAMTAYAETLDKYLNDQVLAVRYTVGDESVACPMTAREMASKSHTKVQYRVASFTFEDQEKADRALAAAKKAVNGGGCAKTCCKSAAAKTASAEKKSCGEKVTEVAQQDSKSGCGSAKATEVAQKDGESKSIGCCKEAAGKVDVARAKIENAIKAIAEVAGA